MRLPEQSQIIKIAAVITAGPRWVIALLWADGVRLPETWEGAWLVYSVVSALGMAVVEGWAFSYIFNAWSRETDEYRARRMLAMAILSAITFVALLTPSIAASVANVAVGTALTTAWMASNWPIMAWSAMVALSTIVIVAGVGYAQRRMEPRAKTAPTKQDIKLPAPAKETPAEDVVYASEAVGSELNNFRHGETIGRGRPGVYINPDVPTPTSFTELAAQVADGIPWTKTALAKRGVSPSTAGDWLKRARKQLNISAG